MFTRKFYKNTIERIKDLKQLIKIKPYLADDPDIISEKQDIMSDLVSTIAFTPFMLAVDLIALPLELIYLILYKIIWKEKR
jgi:hypothetical protein